MRKENCGIEKRINSDIDNRKRGIALRFVRRKCFCLAFVGGGGGQHGVGGGECLRVDWGKALGLLGGGGGEGGRTVEMILEGPRRFESSGN